MNDDIKKIEKRCQKCFKHQMEQLHRAADLYERTVNTISPRLGEWGDILNELSDATTELLEKAQNLLGD